jgi:hypothetical protein
MRIGVLAAVGAALGIAVVAVGCSPSNETTPTASTLPNPDSLTYTLLGGAPGSPSGVLLSWAPAGSASVVAYDIFSRNATSASWGQIGTTILSVFEDAEQPSLQYYVASQDQYGDVSTGTAAITVDTTNTLGAPGGLTVTAFDSAAQLVWAPVVSNDSAGLAYYNVYSEAPSSGACPSGYTLTNLYLEGSTASYAFVSTNLTNGTMYCFAISAVSTSGQESLLGGWVPVTPASTDAVLDAVSPHLGPLVAHGSGRKIQFAAMVRATSKRMTR